MLNLTPFERDDAHTDAEINPKRLKEWLEQLLPFDPARSIKEILGALRAFNAQELPNKARLELLHIYRRKINEIFDAYETPTFHKSIRTSGKRGRIKEDIGRLTSDLANGYKSIVIQEHEKSTNAHNDQLYRQAIYCAMEQTIFTLVHAFRLYGPLPRKAHHDLHQLYQLAERHKALYLPVRLGNGPAPSETIGKLYKQFLLLSIIDPFHLGRGEALKVFQFLFRYTPAAEIVKEVDCRAQDGLFTIDMSADCPPVACKRSAPEHPPKEHRILDVSQVISLALRDQINENVSQSHRVLADQGRRLLSQLIPQFRGGLERVEPRAPVHWTTRIATGLPSLHYFLRQGPRQIAGDDVDGISVQIIDSVTKMPPDLETWTVIEESAGGYRLSCKGNASELEVGDAMGIIDDEYARVSPHMRLGLIRWVRQDPQGLVLVGIEKAPAIAVPVTCLTEGADPATESTECLLLPGPRDHNTPTLLLCPRGVFTTDQTVGINRGRKTLFAQLFERALETACVDGFTFTPAGKST